MTNNLKAERTLTAEELQKLQEDASDLIGFYGRRTTLTMDAETVKAMASMALQSLSTQQPMGEVRMVYEAITNASDLLNVVILAGTAITQGDDGPVSSLTPLAMQANSVWCDLLSAGSILSALHPNQESGE